MHPAVSVIKDVGANSLALLGVIGLGFGNPKQKSSFTCVLKLLFGFFAILEVELAVSSREPRVDLLARTVPAALNLLISSKKPGGGGVASTDWLIKA